MTETTTPRAPGPRVLTPQTVAAYLVAAFCALLLAKWLAVAALAALALFVVLRWLAVRLVRARRGPHHVPYDGPLPEDRAAVDTLVALTGAEDCSWCGRAGGHVDPLGRPLRPRHAHGMSGAA